MDITKLPEDLREMVLGLKHGAYTIETEIQDALENSKNLDEFKLKVRLRMNSLINSCVGIKDVFCGHEEDSNNLIGKLKGKAEDVINGLEPTSSLEDVVREAKQYLGEE